MSGTEETLSSTSLSSSLDNNNKRSNTEASLSASEEDQRTTIRQRFHSSTVDTTATAVSAQDTNENNNEDAVDETEQRHSTEVAGDDDLQETSKEISADLICPITLELPFDPVIAKDGRVYERAAIEEFMQKSHPDPDSLRRVKSPITNAKMGRQLVPAPQIKSLIQTLIQKGMIQGDLAKAWQEKVDEQNRKGKLLQDAANGNVEAMGDVGLHYFVGTAGFPQDQRLSYQWAKKAHEGGRVESTALLGDLILYSTVDLEESHSSEENQFLGLVYTTMAAERGSNTAAFGLAQEFATGEIGLPVNKSEAIQWLQKCLDPSRCAHQHMTQAGEIKARELLAELQRQQEQEPEPV